jgi:DNA-binding SARP family transcriptional activator
LTKPRHGGSAWAGDLARGLAALVAIVVLAAGVPAALALIVGWPLPHAVPSVSELSQTLTSGSIPDEFFANVLAVLGWIYWAHFMVCLGAEIAAARRGRLAHRVPFAGWNQAIAARLIAAVLLLAPSPGLARAIPAFAATPPVAAATIAPATPGHRVDKAPEQPAERAGLDLERPAAALPVYVVRGRQPGKPGDTLWSIAQRHLGDPYRWREIFQLNKARPQPDGRSMQDPEGGVVWIFPGWRLLLPADATGLPAAPPQHDRPARAGHPQADRRQAAPASPSPHSTAAPTTTHAATTTHTPTSTTPPNTGQEGTRPSRAGRRPPATTAAPADRAHTPDRAKPVVSVAPVALAIGGLLAAGVLTTVARLRRRQRRYRQPGRRVRLPVGAAARTEQHLRAAAEPESARFLDVALRAMAAGIHRAGLAPPTVEAVQLSPATVEILLRDPSTAAPPPFTLTDDGRRWTLSRDRQVARLEASAADAVTPVPALVTVGTSSAGQLLLNLEAPGLTALAGPPALTRPLLDAMAVELATAGSSGFVQVLLVGFGSELDRLERVQRVERLEDALPGLERQAEDTAQLLDERGCGSVLGGRIADVAGDSWAPTVVLIAQPPAPAALERLAAVTRTTRGSTVAAVLADDAPQAGWRLQVAEEQVRIPALDLEIHPQRLTAAEYAAIGELLRTAGDVDGVQAGTPPYDKLQPPPAVPDEATETGEAPAVEVCILGRIELRGVRTIERSKAIELIVYLALHPRGVDGDHLWEALWPDKPLNRGTLHTTVTAARTGLGRAPDRSRYLPDARNGRYRLSDAVGLDWARFQALVRRGHGAGPDAMHALRQALKLVRGTPLESLSARSYEWAVVHRTEMETVIAEVAERLALLYLDADDPEQANWAARRGLAASPYDERLYRVLMRAAQAAGNPAGVETVWQELLTVLGADPDLIDEDVHPETIALYTALRRPSRTRPATPPQDRRSRVPLN